RAGGEQDHRAGDGDGTEDAHTVTRRHGRGSLRLGGPGAGPTPRFGRTVHCTGVQDDRTMFDREEGLQRGAAIRRANALGAEPEAGRATVGSIEVLALDVHVVAEPGRYARQPWAR